MPDFTLVPQGPFSLEEAARFGFGQRHDTSYDGVMRLAFCLDGSWEARGVALTQGPDGAVQCAGDPDAADQTARALSLDVDGTGFVEVGARDPVIGRLQSVATGLRPPLFYSAYEAAAWCVLSARRSGRQMQAVRARLSAATGTTFELAGQPLSSFPPPLALLAVESFPGLDAVKINRLRAIARAALDGRLDTETLRAMDPAEAQALLQELPGIGPFSSSLVVVRALGHTDVLPVEEPRSLAVIGELYGLERPATAAELRDIAEPWRPFRTWALVLARAASGRLPLSGGRPTGDAPGRAAGSGRATRR